MEPFIAEVMVWGCNFAPRGWAQCNGQLLPIAQNTALFSLIGTTYGGDGRSTTALPNFQGRMPMHPGRGPGLTTRQLGQRGGTETVTLSEAQMPAHNHRLLASASTSGTSGPAGHSYPTGPFYADEKDSTMHPNSVSNVGGGQAHNNMSPFLSLNICIALQGLYPSRS